MMTDFMTFRDLAATALFMPTYRNLQYTFKTVNICSRFRG